MKEELKKCCNCQFACKHWCRVKKQRGFYRCFFAIIDNESPKDVFKDATCNNWKLRNE